MAEINVLSPDISNQIAAGEVVERPSSIVKELIENAVDAGSTQLTIEIKNGGIQYIRVTDNGKGIPSNEVESAFLRHATSKFKDLHNITTLGFRGEALSSIAAVSKVEIMTKREGEEGRRLELIGGVVESNTPAGCPTGTTIVVRDVFFNTPARLKFLKSTRSEAASITDLVEKLALTRPDIAIKYIIDGKVRLQTTGDGELLSSIYNIYGKEYSGDSVKKVDYEHEGIRVTGYVGKGELSRGNRNYQTFSINGRFVKSSTLTAAAESAYDKRIMTGKFPFLVIALELSPLVIDVNVHPTKMEVKFSNSKQIFQTIYWGISSAFEQQSKPIVEVRHVDRSQLKEIKEEPIKQELILQDYVQEEVITSRLRYSEDHSPPNLMSPLIEDRPQYRIIGQAFETYIIIEKDAEVILIDQHAAHERQIYENLHKGKIEPQILMLPINIALTQGEIADVEENADLFKKLGFDIDIFGEKTIAVRQIPTDLTIDEIQEVIFEVIKKGSAGRLERAMYTIACKAAVKANHSLRESEMRKLADWVLDEKNSIDTCPHGRPLTYKLGKTQIEKLFGRIV